MKYIIAVTLFSLVFNSCIKEECKIAGGFYEFEIPATLTPEKDTFLIGDTITIISTFPDLVYERETDKWYKLVNFKFFPGTFIYKIDSIELVPSITSYFDYLIDSMSTYSLHVFNGGTQGLWGQYTYNNELYYLQYQLIPKIKGLYYLEQGISPDIDPNQSFVGKCSNVNVDGIVRLNNGSDNNIEFLKDSPDPHYNTWILQKPDDRFHKFGGYCFYVME